MITIVIDGFKLPIEMIAGFTQDYQYQHNATTHRSINGTPWRQTTWKKTVTTISGSSWIPSVITDLDYDEVHQLRCAIPISVIAPVNNMVIDDYDSGAHVFESAIKPFRRDDAFNMPIWFAVVDGKTVNAIGWEGSVDGQAVQTVDPVEGAEYYIMTYQPVLQVLIDPPRQSLDSSGAAYAWSMTATEV